MRPVGRRGALRRLPPELVPSASARAETLLGFDPRIPGAWVWIAELQKRLGHPELGLDAARVGLEIAPANADLARQHEQALCALNLDAGDSRAKFFDFRVPRRRGSADRKPGANARGTPVIVIWLS